MGMGWRIKATHGTRRAKYSTQQWSRAMTSDIVERITEYLSAGGLFNPELMEHDKVRDMVIQCRDEIESLRSRLAEAEYQWKYWMGVADDNGIKSIKARLAKADALLRNIYSYAEDQGMETLMDMIDAAMEQSHECR
jgi:hypothetical protein